VEVYDIWDTLFLPLRLTKAQETPSRKCRTNARQEQGCLLFVLGRS
jgi:hypothetical protein